MPLIVSFLILLISTGRASIIDIIKNGELLLIIGAMSFVALGEVVGRGGKFVSARIFFGGASGFAAVTSLALFTFIAYTHEAYASAQLSQFTQYVNNRDRWVSNLSIIFFVAAVLSCGACTLLSGDERNG